MFKKLLLILGILLANTAQSSPQVIILLGPPGAGKGSQAAYITKSHGLAHISTGDLLRENTKEGTELGKIAKTYMDKGALVPDDLILNMLFERVSRDDCKKGFILDGFPRTVAQAKELDARLGVDQNLLAINFHVPDSVLFDRICGRLICKECGKPYHLTYSPPKETGKCDSCKGELYQRSDDSKEVLTNRLDVYKKQTEPLIAFYEKKGALHTIASDGPKDTISHEVSALIH